MPERVRRHFADVIVGMDYDAPMEGFVRTGNNIRIGDPESEPMVGDGRGSMWRKPMISMQAVINIAHIFGYPGRGWEVCAIPRGDYEGYEERIAQAAHAPAWIVSAATMEGTGIRPEQIAAIRRMTRRCDGFFPTVPVRRSAIGGRRGPKRFRPRRTDDEGLERLACRRRPLYIALRSAANHTAAILSAAASVGCTPSYRSPSVKAPPTFAQRTRAPRAARAKTRCSSAVL